MPRHLLSWLFVWLALAVPALAQSNGSLLGLNVGAPLAQGGGSTYVGPEDIVSGVKAWYSCTYGISAAYATGSNKACKIRRASDGATQDINILSTGLFDSGSYNTFVGTDTTASCTLSGTAAVCTGASGTVHINDPVTGAGIANPCIVATASNTAPVLEIAGTTTSCGTVGVGETLTFQVAGFVATAYDQSSTNACTSAPCDASSLTTHQPQLLPLCLDSGTLPCIFLVRASSQNLTSASITATFQTYTMSVVAERPVADGNTGSFLGFGNDGIIAATSAANTWEIYSGAPATVTANDGVLHALEAIFNSTSSIAYLDGTAHSSLSAGTSQALSPASIGTDGFGDFSNSYFGEGGIWPSGFTGANDKAMCNNKSARYGMSLTCN